ncbi:MAG: hypothetical protein A2Z52_00135 [Candidatus Moranbacteria bacterium RBG_19FT_COMBO_42_6]|nr:MAG: hypothetical protein A2Z52_00135 [Candidatus Moranbacteria bacterium RBG_19FT_COMBO_42_6]
MARKIIGVLALVGLFVGLNPALAAKPNYAPEFPDKDGTYEVPGHPNMKVRVFVHKPNPGKPGPVPTPTCSDAHENIDTVGTTGWHLPSTFTYTLNTSSVPSAVGGERLPEIASLSAGKWDSLSGKINLIQSSETTTINRARSDGKNIVSWGRTSGNALAVTYTWYYPSDGLVAESDIIMNSKFHWSWQACSNSSYDVQNIMTHEMGHWMGLDDELNSNFADDTMYGYGSTGEYKKDTLEQGDIDGFISIYNNL